jgi:cation transport ATPase
MIDTNRDNTFTPLDHTSMASTIEQEKTAAVQSSWWRRIWLALKSYPLPLGALALLLVSLALWLAGYANLANWVLLVIILLGGIPLLWETLKHFIHKEFSVDFIAILAITCSPHGPYLARGTTHQYSSRGRRSGHGDSGQTGRVNPC